MLGWAGNYAVARVLAEEAVALARTLGDPHLLAMALSELSFVMRIEAPQTARMLLEESLALARQVGDRGLMSQALARLGGLSWHEGDWGRARELAEESAELARRRSRRRGRRGGRCHWQEAVAFVLEEPGDA